MTGQMDKPRASRGGVNSTRDREQGVRCIHNTNTHTAVATPAMPARRGRQSVRCAVPPVGKSTQARSKESTLGQQRSVCRGDGRAGERQVEAQPTQSAAPHELWPLQTSKHRHSDPCATLLSLQEHEGSWRAAAACAPGQPLAQDPKVSRQQRYDYTHVAHARMPTHNCNSRPSCVPCLRADTAYADSQGTAISQPATATMPQAVGRLRQPQPPRKAPPGSLHSP